MMTIFPFLLLPFLLCSIKVTSRLLNIQKHLKLPNLDCLHWNRFKGLDLIDRVPKELWTKDCDFVQETGIKTISKKKKWKKAKWLSEELLQIVKKRQGKGEKERYAYLNAELQRIARREIRKPSSVINTKKSRKTIEWGRLEISSKKLEIPREHFMQSWAQ